MDGIETNKIMMIITRHEKKSLSLFSIIKLIILSNKHYKRSLVIMIDLASAAAMYDHSLFLEIKNCFFIYIDHHQ